MRGHLALSIDNGAAELAFLHVVEKVFRNGQRPVSVHTHRHCPW